MKLSDSFLALEFLHVGKFNANNRGDNVKGRLKGALNFWRNTLNASDFVLSTNECGYRLPFADYPPHCFLPNNLSAVKHRAFVSWAIKELLADKCIQEHNKPPFCVNPLKVAVGKKLRLVIDLRHVNQYLVKSVFSKYEDLPHHPCSWQSYKPTSRAVARALIGGGVNIHIFVLCPTNFF